MFLATPVMLLLLPRLIQPIDKTPSPHFSPSGYGWWRQPLERTTFSSKIQNFLTISGRRGSLGVKSERMTETLKPGNPIRFRAQRQPVDIDS